ncbi:spore germination protein [Cohnella rhizosphaerae]|uniref:Spore germination protein n=1 Tax=Cohnella rhizosphaerae TaxID=1457232 RepID=A0A9X4KYM0_9BACL|nr:spore germination protein [Cohnella rhizosphaerae]MDG0813741.1 spore germination protein [Cohnella rhizosphaerae]
MLDKIKETLGTPADFTAETMDNGYAKMQICFFPGMCDMDQLKDGIVIPFSYRFDPDEFRRMLHTSIGFMKDVPEAQWVDFLLKGYILLEYEGEVFVFRAIRRMQTQPDQTQVEASLQGPQSAFTENLDLNLTLIRNLYNVPELTVENFEPQNQSKSKIALLYDRTRRNATTLDEVRKRLRNLDKGLLLSAGQLAKQLSQTKYRLFPITQLTERPDRLSIHLNKGKLAVLLDGSRFAILLPVHFFDFMYAMDDHYEPSWMSRFLIGLRYISMILTLLLPALYISIVSYNPEVFRVQLAFTIDGSRAAVPYPSFIEVLLMLFMIEALIEASLRLAAFGRLDGRDGRRSDPGASRPAGGSGQQHHDHRDVRRGHFQLRHPQFDLQLFHSHLEVRVRYRSRVRGACRRRRRPVHARRVPVQHA